MLYKSIKNSESCALIHGVTIVVYSVLNISECHMSAPKLGKRVECQDSCAKLGVEEANSNVK